LIKYLNRVLAKEWALGYKPEYIYLPLSDFVELHIELGWLWPPWLARDEIIFLGVSILHA
jgi:hypothetical protein